MFALGELLRTNGHERLAITCYKDLLKECPLSLQAIDALLSLGVKGNEISGIILEGNTRHNIIMYLLLNSLYCLMLC